MSLNNGNITYVITEDGLSSITDGSNTYAQGGLYLWDAKDFHQLNSSQSFFTEPLIVNKGDNFYNTVKQNILSKTKTESSSGILVTHQYNSIKVEYNYTLASPALNIAVKITNESDDKQITCPAIGGLLTSFAQVPSGLGYKYSKDELNKLHPSSKTPTYCGYLKDNSFGISVYTTGVKNVRNLAHFDYDSDPKNRYVEYHLREFIYPRESKVFNLHISAATNSTVTGLLRFYKDDLLKQYEQRSYPLGDRRFIFGYNVTGSGSNNPYGLFNNSRLDSASGALAFYSQMRTFLSGSNTGASRGRGLVIYDLHGYSPTHQPYELWPQSIEENVWELDQNFGSGNLQLGIKADLHLQPIRDTWTTNKNISLWPVQEYTPDIILQGSNFNLIKYKFQKVNDYEFNLYFSPNGGESYESALLIPNIQPLVSGTIFYGYGCDWTASKTGFHTIADYNNRWATRTQQEFFGLMRYVYGDIDIYCEKGVVSGSPSLFDYEDYVLSNRMGIWVRSSGDALIAASRQALFLNSNGQFS